MANRPPMFLAVAVMCAATGWVPMNAQDGAYRAGAGRLSGTYELDRARSDNPDRIADQAVRSIQTADHDRVYQNLVARMTAPDSVSIDLRGRSVTIMSSTGPRLTFDADGRSRTETGRNGQPQTTRADLRGDQLVVSTIGNRGSDFTVQFDPTPDGLRVTRELDSEVLQGTVLAHSVYRRVADEPRWDVYNDRRGDLLVPDGTQLTARLDREVSTRSAREGERFTAAVVGPRFYAGALLDGVVSRANGGGGRATMVFDFDRIRLPNGESGPFAGAIASVRTPNGDVIRVDRSGAVRDAQGGASAQDTALGAALGAIVGAIAGGGKGAGIGALAGGAGTLIIEGRDDLTLPGGTEIIISSFGARRLPAPRN